MPTYRAQITIPYFTNLPTDVIVNDWHMLWPVGLPSTSDFENMRNMLVGFYDAAYTIGGGDDLIAPWVGAASASIKVYRVDDPPPRAPHFAAQASITAVAPTSSTTPCEVAICCSFQGTPESGQPQARRRGRIFLGGLAGGIDPGDNNEFPHVGAVVRSGLCSAMENLRNDLIGVDWNWVVWSRVGGTATPVTNGWVDDAPDTQRRRGQETQVRNTWP